jgi:hypothetical protein
MPFVEDLYYPYPQPLEREPWMFRRGERVVVVRVTRTGGIEKPYFSLTHYKEV